MRTPERCFASTQNREAVPRPSSAMAERESRENPPASVTENLHIFWYANFLFMEGGGVSQLLAKCEDSNARAMFGEHAKPRGGA